MDTNDMVQQAGAADITPLLRQKLCHRMLAGGGAGAVTVALAHLYRHPRPWPAPCARTGIQG
jgi:hypothetical protein